MSPTKLATFSLFALISTLACGDSGGTGDSPEGCTPGETQGCACTNGESGSQTCASDGRSFGECECEGGLLQNCNNDGVEDIGEQCDDGNTDNEDGCTQACFPELFCGDGLETGSEQCDDAGADGGENDVCPDDCNQGGGGAGGGGGTGGTGGIGEGGAPPCDPQATVIMAAIVAAQTPVWTSNGLVGLDAGNDMCNAAALGSHVCTYAELLVAEAKPDNLEPNLGLLATGTTLWVHRDTPEMVNGMMSVPGAGARCNDWTYPTNHISDGEYAEVTLPSDLTFSLDNDSFFDGVDNTHALAGLLQCGGETRAIPCCNPCIPPPVQP